MKILITGATGFIGSNLMNYFSKKYDVYGTTRKKSNSHNFIQIDLLDLTNEKELIGKYDVIIHCASILATNENHKNINLLYDNLKISESLISIIAKTEPQLVINLSTIGVYPNIDGTYTETSQIKPGANFEGLYGLSKFCGEEIFSFFFDKTKTRIVNLRLGQTIGEGMRDDRIYSVMKNELQKQNCINVYGNGERTSAFISIDFFIKTIENIIEDKDISGTFNLAETNLSYLELAEQIIEEYGNSNSKIKILSKGSSAKIVIDSSKIKNLLNG